jgi:response regulator RpfG family c-di-GMP phosphodiesterase
LRNFRNIVEELGKTPSEATVQDEHIQKVVTGDSVLRRMEVLSKGETLEVQGEVQKIKDYWISLVKKVGLPQEVLDMVQEARRLHLM